MSGRAVVCGGGDALNPKRKLKTLRDRPLNSVFASAPKPFLDSGAMLSFGAVGVNKSRNSFSQSFDQEEGGDEYLDEYCNQPEKKKRISVDQVQFLERNFQAENKLEPERKIQLAKELGLQPRQIAIWFQNRRARWKTRQLETDYETLHASYKSLKTNYDNLLEENEKLKAEVLHLKCNGLAADTEKENLQLCDAKEPSQTMPEAALTNVISEDGGSRVSAVALKNEEQSSAKSDATSVEISTNVVHSAILEMGDLSLVPEFDGSDLSHGCFLPMVEDAHCFPPESSFYHGFPDQDHTFSFWSG